MSKAKKKLLINQSKGLYKLSQLFNNGVLSFEDISEIVPGILHINSREDLAIQFMSKHGCEELGYSEYDLKQFGAEILLKHQSKYTLEVTYPKLFKKLALDDERLIIPFFQDWKHNKNTPSKIYFTSTKILNSYQTISISLIPADIEFLNERMKGFFHNSCMYDSYYEAFQRLTKREKEILDYLGKEYSRKEIAQVLFIEESTVKKHCENIFRKLGTSKRVAINKIANAFNS